MEIYDWGGNVLNYDQTIKDLQPGYFVRLILYDPNGGWEKIYFQIISIEPHSEAKNFTFYGIAQSTYRDKSERMLQTGDIIAFKGENILEVPIDWNISEEFNLQKELESRRN